MAMFSRCSGSGASGVSLGVVAMTGAGRGIRARYKGGRCGSLSGNFGNGACNAAIAGAATKIASQFVFACTARLEPREMRLAPLPNTPLLRDLATVIAPPDERL